MNESNKSYMYLQTLINDVPLTAEKRETAIAHLLHLQQRERTLTSKVQEFQDKLDETNSKIKSIKRASNEEKKN